MTQGERELIVARMWPNVSITLEDIGLAIGRSGSTAAEIGNKLRLPKRSTMLKLRATQFQPKPPPPVVHLLAPELGIETTTHVMFRRPGLGGTSAPEEFAVTLARVRWLEGA
jgi:hypothetical protein